MLPSRQCSLTKVRNLTGQVGKPKPAPEITIVGIISNRHPLTSHYEVGPEILLSHWNVNSRRDIMFLAQTKANAKVMAQPIRDALLSLDARLFIGAKMVLTGVGIVGLVAYSEFLLLGRYRIGRSLGWLIGFYALLICYEISLLSLL